MRAAIWMSALALGACDAAVESEVGEPVTLRFAATVGDAPFACRSTYEAMGPFAGAFTARDLRLYVHDVALLSADGAVTPVILTPDALWQSDRLAFLDFEDGSAGCKNGTPATRTVIEGRAPRGDYTGVRFTLGVPFDLNHGDPTRSTAPLGRTSMHWSWQAGHKFVRLGLGDGDTDARLHLGSTGCEGTIGAISGCDRGNRPVVTLTGFDPLAGAVTFDVARLFAGLAPGEDAACMGDAGTSACAGAFEALGLDLHSGQPAGPATAFEGAR